MVRPINVEALRQARVRQLFQARMSDVQTETGVLLFYVWLRKHCPQLLPSGPGDRYEHLRVDLTGLYK